LNEDVPGFAKPQPSFYFHFERKTEAQAPLLALIGISNTDRLMVEATPCDAAQRLGLEISGPRWG
jgi:hypothetical protein